MLLGLIGRSLLRARLGFLLDFSFNHLIVELHNQIISYIFIGALIQPWGF